MKLLFLDIETSPNIVYTWGLFKQNISVNQIIKPGSTLCWAAKWAGKREVMFDSVNQSTQKAMIKGIYDLLNEADAVVHFNGKSFDIPTLNREFLLQDLTPPSPAAQIDLYRAVRSTFRFASNSLSFVSQQLGLGNKVYHKGMELWSGCLAGDEASWRTMERYNKQDVRLLSRLYDRMLGWIPTHPNLGVFVDDDQPVCPNCGSTHLQNRGNAPTGLGLYARYQCQDCGKWARGATNLLAPEHRKNILRPVR